MKVSESYKARFTTEYRHQDTDWTCGPAVVRDILLNAGVDVTEAKLSRILQTSSDDGTDGDRIREFFKSLGYETAEYSDSESSIEKVSELLNSGWDVIALITNKFDTSHFVRFGGVSDGLVTLVDPLFGPTYTFDVDEFVKNVWFTKGSDGEKFPKWMCAIKCEKIDPDKIVDKLNEVD